MSDNPNPRRKSYLDPKEFGIGRPEPAKIPVTGENDVPAPVDYDAQTLKPSNPQKVKRTTNHVSVYMSPETEKKFDRLCYEYFSRYGEKINRQDIVRCLLDGAGEEILSPLHQKIQHEKQKKGLYK